MEVTLEGGKETPHPPQVEYQAPPPRVSSLGRSEPYKGNENAKKRRLNWQSKCLQAAGSEVNFPEGE